MKNIFLVSLALLTGYSVFGQSENKFQESALEEGYPVMVKYLFDLYGQYKQSEVGTATIQTGIDSLQVYFGMAEKNDDSGRTFYWSAIASDDSLRSLSAGFILHKDADGLLSNEIELSLGANRPERVVYLARFDPERKVVSYKWLQAKGEATSAASIITNENFKEGNLFTGLDFRLLSGEQLSSKDMKGKTLVINWWNTGCKPCIAEMPGLNSLVEEYSEDENVVFLAVAHNTVKEVSEFLEKRAFKYRQGVYDEKSLAYFGNGYPKHLIINKKGEISYYAGGGGPETHHEIKRALEKAMKE